MKTQIEKVMTLVPVVDNPYLLKVTTIKAKFVDQMPQLEVVPLNGVKVLGMVGTFVIAREFAVGTGVKLFKVHISDWTKHLIKTMEGERRQGWTYKEALEVVEAVTDTYTQLFEV